LASIPAAAQNAEGNLRNELIALHTKWFKAFDSGDGAAMDRMETDNLVLMMPDGTICLNRDQERESNPNSIPKTERSLSEVSVRQFGTYFSLDNLGRFPSPFASLGHVLILCHFCDRFLDFRKLIAGFF
jgi:hypothetical protein